MEAPTQWQIGPLSPATSPHTQKPKRSREPTAVEGVPPLRLGLRHPRQYSHTVQRIIFEYTLGRILTKYTMGRINQGMRELARDPKQIGNLIRGERKRKAMSQKELASRAGLRQASVSAIENGSPTTKLQTLLAVLSTLGLEFQISSRSTGDWNIGG